MCEVGHGAFRLLWWLAHFYVYVYVLVMGPENAQHILDCIQVILKSQTSEQKRSSIA